MVTIGTRTKGEHDLDHQNTNQIEAPQEHLKDQNTIIGFNNTKILN
jgi:hypothetical protein